MLIPPHDRREPHRRRVPRAARAPRERAGPDTDGGGDRAARVEAVRVHVAHPLLLLPRLRAPERNGHRSVRALRDAARSRVLRARRRDDTRGARRGVSRAAAARHEEVRLVVPDGAPRRTAHRERGELEVGTENSGRSRTD